MINDFFSYINKDNNILDRPNFCCVWDIFNKMDYEIKGKLSDLIENINNDKIKIIYDQYKDRKFSAVYDLYLNKIKNVSSVDELKVLMEELVLKKLIDSPLLINNNKNILCYSVGNLGLNNKEYYLNCEFSKIKNYYLKLMKRLLGNCINYMEIYNFEYEIAKILKKPNETIELTLDEFRNEFRNIFILNQGNIIKIENYKLLKFVDNFIETNFSQFREYLLWNYVYINYGLLSEENEEYKFNNLTKYMLGTNEMYPKWYRCINYLDSISIFSNTLGYYYSMNCKNFDNNYLIKLLKFIIPEYILFINKWENIEIKNRVLDKIKHLKITININNNINNNLQSINLDNDFFTNHINLNYNTSIQNLTKNYNFIQPHHVNAIYLPITNEIILPISLFQNDIFYNFYSLGFIITHEIVHSFDSVGIKYDYNGNYSNINLNEKFYNKLLNMPFYNKNTCNELLADIIGLNITYSAYKKYLGNYTDFDLKEFFINFTKFWNINITDEEFKRRQLMDTHPLHKDRVNISLAHIDDFYNLFNIDKNSSMWLDKDKRII